MNVKHLAATVTFVGALIRRELDSVDTCSNLEAASEHLRTIRDQVNALIATAEGLK